MRKSRADLITAPYSDLTVVNAARVSFDKESTVFTMRKDKPKGSDEGLLQYLANHNHWTPFAHVRETFILSEKFDFAVFQPEDLAGMVWDKTGMRIRHSLWGWKNLLEAGGLDPLDQMYIASTLHSKYPHAAAALGIPYMKGRVLPELNPSMETETNPDFIDITMRETVPLFVARQRFKHMVGFTYNEISRRYVDDTPEFHVPGIWRSRPDGSVKQGSGGPIQHNRVAQDRYASAIACCVVQYEELLSMGVAPEQARMILPQSMLTSYYVTGTLSAWARAYRQRIDAHAQKEIQELAWQWEANIRSTQYAPIWSDLVTTNNAEEA